MTEIVKIGNVELTPQEAQRYATEGRYIVTRSRIYQIVQWAGAYHGKVVYTAKGMTRPGRFYAMTAATINDIFGTALN